MSEAEVCKSFSEDKRKREIPSAAGAKAHFISYQRLANLEGPRGHFVITEEFFQCRDSPEPPSNFPLCNC